MDILDNRYNSKTGYVKLSVDIREDKEIEEEEKFLKQLEYRVGNVVTIKADEKDGYEFLYFYNPIKKKIITKAKEYLFNITEDTFIYLVYKKLSASELKRKYDIYNFAAPLVKDDEWNVKIDKNFVNFIDENQTDKDIPSSKAILSLIDKLHEKIDGDYITFTEADKENIQINTSNMYVLNEMVRQLQESVQEILDGEHGGYEERFEELYDLINSNTAHDNNSKTFLLERINDLKNKIAKNTADDKKFADEINNKIEGLSLEEETENIIFDGEDSDWNKT